MLKLCSESMEMMFELPLMMIYHLKLRKSGWRTGNEAGLHVQGFSGTSLDSNGNFSRVFQSPWPCYKFYQYCQSYNAFGPEASSVL